VNPKAHITAATIDRPSTKDAVCSSIWIIHLVGLGALVGLVGVLNADAIAAAVRVWIISPTYSHCFFVLPLSAFIIWRRRHSLAARAPAAEPRLLWLLPLPIILLLAGDIAHINEFEQFALIGLVQVLILTVLGAGIYRSILFPCLFLFFLVPAGEYLIVPLQDFTTHFIADGLTLLGIPHYTEGYILQLSNGDYEVAEACAGLRFLIATTAVGVLFVHLNYRKWSKIVIFMAATIVVPVIANGFRALGIVLLGYWSDNRIAHGVDHIVYGWGFLVAILCLLMAIGVRFSDQIQREEPNEPVSLSGPRPGAFAITVLVSLVAISSVPSWAYWQSRKVLHLNDTAFSAPIAPIGWQTAAAPSQWSPDYPPPDLNLAFEMHMPKLTPVDVFVKYYAGQNGGRGLIRSTNLLWADGWRLLSQQTVAATLADRPIHLTEAVITSAGAMRIIWWAYWSGDRFTTSELEVKADRLRQAITGSGGSALFTVSTPVQTDIVPARTRLRQAIGALGFVVSRLQAADRS